MKVYVKNEAFMLKGNKRFDDLMKKTYGAKMLNGLYEVEMGTMEDFNKFIKEVVISFEKPSVYPFITPYTDSLQINLRIERKF